MKGMRGILKILPKKERARVMAQMPGLVMVGMVLDALVAMVDAMFGRENGQLMVGLLFVMGVMLGIIVLLVMVLMGGGTW